MKRNLLIALSMLCVLTAIAGGTRIFKNKTANTTVNASALLADNTADYENLCMALDCLDSQLLANMEENNDFAFANVASEISNLRTQVDAANKNGNLNRDEFIAAMDQIQGQMY